MKLSVIGSLSGVGKRYQERYYHGPSVLTDFTTASQFAHHKPHADFFSSLTILFLCSSVNFAWKGLKFNSMRSYHHKRQQTQLQPPHHHSKDLQFPTAAPAK